MCFDDAALKYVPCQTSSNARGAEVSNPPAERNVYVCVEGQRYIRDGVNGLIYVSNHCRKNDTLID
jgi:hypothetical protein